MTVPKKYECPEKLYNIMKACWYSDPEPRPEFRVLSDFLEEFNTELERQYNK